MSNGSQCQSELLSFDAPARAADRAEDLGVPSEFMRPPGASNSTVQAEGATFLIVTRIAGNLAHIVTFYASSSEIGLWIAPAWRGKGLGRGALTDAMSRLNEHLMLSRLYAVTWNPTGPMGKILQACRFRELTPGRQPSVWCLDAWQIGR